MDKSLWIKKVEKEVKDETHWAKLKIKKDKQSNESYIDILSGRKGKAPHAHIGVNLDQTLKFTEFRGVTPSIQRDVKSLKRGHVESKKVIVDPNLMPAKKLFLKLNMNGTTKEVLIQEFRLE